MGPVGVHRPGMVDRNDGVKGEVGPLSAGDHVGAASKDKDTSHQKILETFLHI